MRDDTGCSRSRTWAAAALLAAVAADTGLHGQAALAAAGAHPQTRDLQLAVNVSARQFHQTDFVAQVDELIKRTGINPSRLKLELTESMVLIDV